MLGVLVDLTLLLAGGDEGRQDLPVSPTSVLLVTLDTTRADHLGCYGGDPEVTPALDALASRGLRFTRAYSPVPYTLPAHASLMTGLQPFEHGVRTNGLQRLPATVTTLAEWFQDHGYETAAFVSSEVLGRSGGLAQGFALYEDEFPEADGGHGGVRSGADTTTRFLAWLAEARQPFFAWLHYYDPHDPYVEPADLRGRFATAYAAEIYDVDRQFARVLRFLEERPDLGDPWICVTADHGESLGEHGELTHGVFLYEPVMHVPLILVHPSVPPRTAPELVGLVDLAPTLASLAGVPGIACGGRDLAAGVRDPAAMPPERPLYLESYVPWFLFGWSPLEAIVAGEWKYVSAPAAELYHLAEDPSESRNRAAERSDLGQRLAAVLEALRSTPDARAEIVREDPDLRHLGYVAGASDLLASDLPRPGPEAGADPKSRTQALELIQSLVKAEVNRQEEQVVLFANQVLARDPGNPYAAEALGKSLVRRRRYDEALPGLEALDRAGRCTPDGLVALGVARFRTGDVDGASVALERSMERKTSPLALHALGLIAEERDEPGRALELHEAALRDLPPDSALRRAIEAHLAKRGPQSPPPRE